MLHSSIGAACASALGSQGSVPHGNTWRWGLISLGICSSLVSFAATANESSSGDFGFLRNPGAVEQPTSHQSDKRQEEISGNGVILATGNKIEPEQDFGTQGEMPLHLVRVYNHYWSATGLFGGHWLSNFDYSLAFSTDRSTAWLQRPDGRRIKFVSAASNRWNEDKTQPIAYLVQNADSTYTLLNEDRGSERYGADGYILERRNAHGISWTFSYTGSYLQRVTHTSGRHVQLGWSSNQLTEVTDPAGNVFRYAYTPNVFGTGRGRLASTVLPGTPATTITYHYEDGRFPGGLTGKSINGLRHSSVAYDAEGRTASVELAGGVARYSYVYSTPLAASPPPPAPPPPGGFTADEGGGWCEYRDGSRICYQPRLQIAPDFLSVASSAGVEQSVVATNPLGRKTTFRFSDGKLASVSGQASPNAPASYKERQYDANGYEDVVSDFEAGLTNFDYDDHGHLLKKVDGAGTSIARTTTFEWDETNNRLNGATVVGDHERTYTYTVDGRLASTTVKNIAATGVANQLQRTTYSYTRHGNGILASMTMDGPLAGSGDAVTYTYSAESNLLSVADSKGHKTTYADHSGMGLPRFVSGPNGDTHRYTYDARGKLLEDQTNRNGSVQAARYEYDGFGRLAAMTAPDGHKLSYLYDVAGRLISEFEPESGGTFAQTLYTYNAMSLPTSVKTQRVSVRPQQGTAP